jgi:hypothetical protein
MACVWVLLASRTTDERLCGKPGGPRCLEHQREITAMERTQCFTDGAESLGCQIQKEAREDQIRANNVDYIHGKG